MLTSGQILGENTVVGPLGKGFFGAVYKINNPNHEKEIALKVCKLPLAVADKNRFQQENTILHTLKVHEKIIVPHSDMLEEDPYVYFTMELADHNLDEYLTINYSALDFSQKIQIFKDIVEGLKYAHQKGIVHRDLWWNNVLIKIDEGRAGIKLNDFGRSKDFSMGGIDSGSEPCWGAYFIMPPEIYLNLFDNSPTLNDYIIGDLYALGAMLFFILDSQPIDYALRLRASLGDFLRKKSIHNINSVNKQARMNIYREWLGELSVQPLQGLKVSLPDQTLNDSANAIISKLCNPDFSKRYQNISELESDLANL